VDVGAAGAHHSAMTHKVVDLRVARALAAVKAEPNRRFSVQELAKVAGASRASFARLFRAQVGTSPQRFLRARRLEQAAALLVGTDERLSRIALRVGYLNEFALSRAFKRHYGVAPARYRQQSAFTIRCAA
jgi:AraC-like DNA-binding protein